jgi:hypothetical protein
LSSMLDSARMRRWAGWTKGVFVIHGATALMVMLYWGTLGDRLRRRPMSCE